MTLKEVLQDVSVERQYEIMALADRTLSEGRYYGGKLSEAEAESFQKVAKR